MIPYTAGDSMRAITRELAVGPGSDSQDRLELALHRKRHISADALRALYQRAGRAAPAEDVDLHLVLAAGPAAGVWIGERLVGFGRALSDGQLVAYIEEVVIDPQYRDQGLGQALITQLLAELAGVAVVNQRGSSGSMTVFQRPRYAAGPHPQPLSRRAGRGER